MMKRSIALCAALLVTAIIGCDNSTAPVDNNPRGGKTPQVLSNCLNEFTNITNCPLGQATLSQTSDGVSVSGMSSNADGVASSFENAISWTRASSILWPSNNNGNLLFSAMSDGDPISTLGITQTATPGEFELSPRFTGGPNGESDYDVNVYAAGVYQGGGRVDGRTDRVRAILHEWDLLWWAWTHFSQRSTEGDPTLGACVWKMEIEGTLTIELGDGTSVTGDAVEFVEHIENGSYPYHSFQGINVQGQVDAYDIFDESIVE